MYAGVPTPDLAEEFISCCTTQADSQALCIERIATAHRLVSLCDGSTKTLKARVAI